MTKLSNGQKEMRLIMTILCNIGLPDNAIYENIPINPATFRKAMVRFDIVKPKKTKKEVFVSALKEYAKLCSKVTTTDLDNKIKLILEEYLGVEEIVKDFEILDKIFKILACPKAGKPDEKYVRLITYIFDFMDLKKIFAEDVWKKSLKAYAEADEDTLLRSVDDLKNDFLKKWSDSLRHKVGAIWSEGKATEVVNEVFTTLTKREVLILKKLFGIDYKKYSLVAIANEMNLTRQRVKQIVSKAISKLGGSLELKKLKGLYWLNPCLLSEEDNSVDLEIFKLDQSIDELGLVLNTQKCLKAAKIYLVNEVVQKTTRELLMIKNFNRRKLKELEARLSDKGLSLRDDTTKFPDQK